MDNEKYNQLKEKINNKAWSNNVPDYIIRDCYKIFFEDESQWKMHNDYPYYIIGLTEDRYDYYWLCINNKEKDLKFITYLFKFDIPCKYVNKKFNKNECKEIVKCVETYFKNHSVKENLIYLDEKLIFLNK